MWAYYVLLGLLVGFGTLSPPNASAATRRALLIGIDLYVPPAPTAAQNQVLSTPETKTTTIASSAAKAVKRGDFGNLDGAVNDVEAMREILIARYGFKPEHIVLLKNGEATHERILAAIRTHLLEPTTAGDIVFFMYAGHGSQVVNSRSSEGDKKDETIVPADVDQEARDIRDKELRRLFNDILDKGVQLTVIFDSCHSGSVVRGVIPPEKARNAPLDPRDIAELVANELEDPRPAPEQRGALIFSAAQDEQQALEATDLELGTKHGAFSLALMKVLRTVGVHESAERVFLRTKALLQNSGRRQEPVLAGVTERLRQPLFSASGETSAGLPTVAVLRVQDDGAVELQGGRAVGLRKDCELEKLGAATGAPTVRVRVDDVQGWSRATARVIAGKTSDIRAGDLFVLKNWVTPGEVLRVWAPLSTLEAKAVIAVAHALASLRQSNQLHWVIDPTETRPTHVVSWDGSQWNLTLPDGKTMGLGKALSPQLLKQQLANVAAVSASLFVLFPPSRELFASLKAEIEKTNGAVEFSSTPQQAHYILVGKGDDKGLSYAWHLPTLTRSEAEDKTSLPVRTDWVLVGEASAPQKTSASVLIKYARRLEQIRAWLQIESPPDQGRFPYSLVFKNKKTGEFVTAGTTSQEETFQLVLRADVEALKRGVEQRYVYVFILDSHGASTLLFPPSGQGNVENRLPYQDVLGQPPTELLLNTDITIGPPFGLDTYVLLTSKETIPDPGVLDTEGVRTARGEKETPLAQLLGDISSGQRGAQRIATSADWSIERVLLRSQPKQ